MMTLHQLRCFLTVYEHGSLTAAAEELGYAQPSISEQIRGLERGLGVDLFRRVGRGVVPTTVADELRPHAERTLAAADEARRAVQSAKSFETGTIRFGMFGAGRHYLSANLVADVLARYPGVRVEITGLNSIEIYEDLRHGKLEVALIAVSSLVSEGLDLTPIARDEIVYVSVDPARLATPVTPHRLSLANLALSQSSFKDVDSTRIKLSQMMAEHGRTLAPKIEVEDVETVIELAGRGVADTVTTKGIADVLIPTLAPRAAYVSLRPKVYETFAIAHRPGATLSNAARFMIELATRRMHDYAEPV
ncbi:MAG: LysR family transcriptional regulator [Nocardioides sp.]|uniref:LysR family transcriptional regulator n=1 Tax=Nocardioides sp. TaxID=35761 RepID=UPI0039E3925C